MAAEGKGPTLANLDEHGKRVFIHPADVRGFFRTLRANLHLVLMLVFLGLPWLRINGEQALLLDIPGRKAHFFGLTLLAQDAPKAFFLIAGLALAIILTTALWGRLWCGYACPQTVFIEFVFRRIERWVEGTHLERQRLDAEERGSVRWVRLKALKWTAFVAAALVMSHSFLAYFVGTDRLRQIVLSPPRENWTAFLAMGIITAVVLVDFAFLREQFCIIACPYGRLQGLLLDRQSLIIAYDAGRGEPRRGAAAEGQAQGDCVDCDRCVQVCPTGIDIRRGLQMECIGCTACVDACDDVMDRLGRAKGLVAYRTEAELAGEPRRVQRPRVLLYGGLLAGALGGLITSLAFRKDLEVIPLRGIDVPYQQVKGPGGEPRVINHLRFQLANLGRAPRTIELAMASADAPRGFSLVMAANTVLLEPARTERTDCFVTFPKAALDFGKTRATVEFREGGKVIDRLEVTLVGPFQ